MLNDVTVFNIREYLSSDDKILGEEQLQKVLSEFLCSKIPSSPCIQWGPSPTT